jgi:hypothetical protein
MVHTGRVPDSDGKTLAESASTWMQVVFGGIAVILAVVGLVIAYFAWVQPHSPDGRADKPAADNLPPQVTTTTGTATAPTAAAAGTALGKLTATVGTSNIKRDGDDLVIGCATGQSTDRQRVVEFDLLGRYAGLETEVRVSKARDTETPLQLKIFADGPEIANRAFTKAGATRLSVPLTGAQKMRLQLTCQFPDGEITLGDPTLTRQ